MPFKTMSFNDFQILKLKGLQKLLTYGQYCNKLTSNKINRQKIIYYNYKKIFESKIVIINVPI